MPRKKPTRHGATQPEETRANKALLLRLPAPVIDRLRTAAAERQTSVSGLVQALVEASL